MGVQSLSICELQFYFVFSLSFCCCCCVWLIIIIASHYISRAGDRVNMDHSSSCYSLLSLEW